LGVDKILGMHANEETWIGMSYLHGLRECYYTRMQHRSGVQNGVETSCRLLLKSKTNRTENAAPTCKM
jgi:hypothetical protein